MRTRARPGEINTADSSRAREPPLGPSPGNRLANFEGAGSEGIGGCPWCMSANFGGEGRLVVTAVGDASDTSGFVGEVCFGGEGGDFVAAPRSN